jgi:hypothetical protein
MQQNFVYYEVTLQRHSHFSCITSFSLFRQVDFKRNRKDVCIGAAGMQVDTFVRVEADRYFLVSSSSFVDFGILLAF